MVWSATSIAAGVELNFTITDGVLRKGIFKFVQLRAPIDVCLLPDDLRGKAPIIVSSSTLVTGNR
jgi:hypothetical protein